MVGLIFIYLLFFQFKIKTASALAGSLWFFLFVSLAGLLQSWGMIVNLRRDYLRSRFKVEKQELDRIKASKSLNPWFLPAVYSFPLALIIAGICAGLIWVFNFELKIWHLTFLSFALAIMVVQVFAPKILKKDLVRLIQEKEQGGKKEKFSRYFLREHLLFWLPVQAVINLALGAGIYLHQFPDKAIKYKAMANDLAITTFVILIILYFLGRNQLSADIALGRIAKVPIRKLKRRTRFLIFLGSAFFVWITIMGVGWGFSIDTLSIYSALVFKVICAVISAGLGLFLAGTGLEQDSILKETRRI